MVPPPNSRQPCYEAGGGVQGYGVILLKRAKRTQTHTQPNKRWWLQPIQSAKDMKERPQKR
ncbi:hypothetical protein OUZ56_020709 [Daphnia magna]|uniref:Uncharacterized protein n=1 Tax=Daphnia magna TaxID=35525 RepID=A0ABQ9ZF80_9CRUS|nr:hypothetical protein OUZ56_020709 [Daphnia magna]